MKIKKDKLIEVENLTVRYGANFKPIIKNFKIEICKEEHLAIIGPSGCG